MRPSRMSVPLCARAKVRTARHRTAQAWRDGKHSGRSWRRVAMPTRSALTALLQILSGYVRGKAGGRKGRTERGKTGSAPHSRPSPSPVPPLQRT